MSNYAPEMYLKAAALIRNRIRDESEELRDDDFLTLIEDIETDDEIVNLLSIVASLAGVILQGIPDFVQAIIGVPVPALAEEGIHIPEMYLDGLVLAILNGAVQASE